jgi:hypothetical protein
VVSVIGSVLALARGGGFYDHSTIIEAKRPQGKCLATGIDDLCSRDRRFM